MDHLVIAKRAGAKLGVVIQRDLLRTKASDGSLEIEPVRLSDETRGSTYRQLRMERARLKLVRLRDNLCSMKDL